MEKKPEKAFEKVAEKAGEKGKVEAKAKSKKSTKKAFDKIADKTKDKVEEKMGDMGKKTNQSVEFRFFPGAIDKLDCPFFVPATCLAIGSSATESKPSLIYPISIL